MCTQRNVTSLLATEPKQSISQIRFAAEFRRHDANQHSPFVFGFVRNCLKCFTNSWFVTLPPFAIIYLRISAMDKSLGAAMFTITNVFVRRGMTHAVVAALWLAALLSTNLTPRTWIAFCFSTLVRSFVWILELDVCSRLCCASRRSVVRYIRLAGKLNEFDFRWNVLRLREKYFSFSLESLKGEEKRPKHWFIVNGNCRNRLNHPNSPMNRWQIEAISLIVDAHETNCWTFECVIRCMVSLPLNALVDARTMRSLTHRNFASTKHLAEFGPFQKLNR